MHTFNTQTLYVKYKPDKSKVKNSIYGHTMIPWPFQETCFKVTACLLPYGTLLVKVQTKLGQGETKLGNNNNTCDL